MKLPDLKPKPNEIFEEIKYKYVDISRTGPESLRHNRKTLLQAFKRMIASGEADKLHHIPGFADPVKLIVPIESDKRYRQYKEITIPSSNAVIFFARDSSGSMDDLKCDIINDMAWWIDIWIRKFYENVERVYICHDAVAQEVNEEKFYKYRQAGGTICSSALRYIEKQLEDRYNPAKWNIYIIYFTDGENYEDDNEVFCDIIKEKFTPNIVNFVGIAQILAGSFADSLKEVVDIKLKGLSNLKTTSIESKGHGYGVDSLTEEERNEQTRRAIMDLLGAEKSKK